MIEGRHVRVVVALYLSLVGLIPVPYYGWVLGLPLFGPAAVLVAFAALDRQTRRKVLYSALPTILGLALALLSAAATARYLWPNGALPSLFGLTLVTSALAAFCGRPERASHMP